jgi:hypothetical protein
MCKLVSVVEHRPDYHPFVGRDNVFFTNMFLCLLSPCPNSDSAELGENKYEIEGDIEQALEQQTVMRQQLKEAQEAEATHEHQEDPDIIMSDVNKKRKHDEILSISETTEGPLKKTTLEGVAHPPVEDVAPLDGVGDGTSSAQAVDLDEVVIVDGKSIDVVILD